MTHNAACNPTKMKRPAPRPRRLGSRSERPIKIGPGAVVAFALWGLIAPPPAVAGRPAAAPTSSPAAAEAPVPPSPRPPEIQFRALPSAPAAGKGRLALAIAGNRRWCTFPDDRLVRPTPKPGTPVKRNEVFTFGYK